MRNGNILLSSVESLHQMVLTVPMRNGNTPSGFQSLSRYSVLTVPMRNGNKSCALFEARARTGSYRTYEEWKPPNFITYELSQN